MKNVKDSGMAAPQEETWISVPAAARRAGITARHAWRLIAAGSVKSKVDGKRRLIASSSLTKKTTDMERKCQFQCQSDLPHSWIVEKILAELKPALERVIQKYMGEVR